MNEQNKKEKAKEKVKKYLESKGQNIKPKTDLFKKIKTSGSSVTPPIKPLNLKKSEELKSIDKSKKILDEKEKFYKEQDRKALEEYDKGFKEWERREKEEVKKKARIEYDRQLLTRSLAHFGQVYMPSDLKDSIEDIIGYEFQKEKLTDFFETLKNFLDYSDELAKLNLIPIMTALLYGASGTGKTHLTRAFSKKYNIPICIIECGKVVDSFLGKTLKNITTILETSARLSKELGGFIVFFDEIDSLGAERSLDKDVGEMRRATITFLQILDKIAYKGIPLAIFGATNHQKTLDSALGRRFTMHLKFDYPNYKIRKGIIELFINKIKNTSIEVDPLILEDLTKEFELIKMILKTNEIDETDDLLWKKLKEKTKSTRSGLLKATKRYSGSDIERGTKVALFKAIRFRKLTKTLFFDSMESVGGTGKFSFTE